MKLPWAWVIWLVAVMLVLSTTRNPLYLVIAILCVVFVGLALRRAGAEKILPFSTWKLAVWIILLATVFNALTSHYGETVLFTIPGHLPLVSGDVTLEALVYGATNGLILTGMLVGFMVLNMALSVRDLVSLIPRAFFPVAVVTSIAVTYLPTTVRQYHEIREAQAVRGHQMRKLRDWLPLLMPLLVGGLEHAMQLAEAMTARGFASAQSAKRDKETLPRVLLLVGVVLLAGGWLLQIAVSGWYGWAVMLVGGGLIGLGIWLLGSHSLRTAYRRPVLSWRDGLGILGALLVMAVFTLPIPGVGKVSLYYDPYPSLSLPLFSPVIGFVMLGLLIPGLLALNRHEGGQVDVGQAAV